MSRPHEELASAPLRLVSEVPGSTNGAWLGELGGSGLRCIYKPKSRERVLWDFPAGSLGHREVLAAQYAEALGWDLLPATVWRSAGPLGPGMCQEWIESVAAEHPAVGLFPADAFPPSWRAIATGHAADGTQLVLGHGLETVLVRMLLFDAVLNNADRKGGHLLRRADGRLVGVDHGLTWHEEPKLRTVLWGWAGEPFTAAVRHDVEHAAHVLERFLAQQHDVGDGWRLSPAEDRAARQRAADLLAGGRFPAPAGSWPALPWPPL